MSGELPMWTIYDHPADYPDHFVVRRWTVDSGPIRSDRDVQLAATLDMAREFIPPGLVRMERSPSDDPRIVETWL